MFWINTHAKCINVKSYYCTTNPKSCIMCKKKSSTIFFTVLLIRCISYNVNLRKDKYCCETFKTNRMSDVCVSVSATRCQCSSALISRSSIMQRVNAREGEWDSEKLSKFISCRDKRGERKFFCFIYEFPCVSHHYQHSVAAIPYRSACSYFMNHALNTGTLPVKNIQKCFIIFTALLQDLLLSYGDKIRPSTNIIRFKQRALVFIGPVSVKST